MDRFTVKIKVKQYNVGVPPQTMYMTYICKNVVGGLSELETTLQYDEEWAGFQYSYSETTLRFCKEDKDFLLKYLFGQNFWQGGVLSQDYSFSIDYLPDVEIVDNYTNTTFIKAKLDINTLKVIPPYIEAALIDNATLKNDIEKTISYSLKELQGLIQPIKTDLYQGNPIVEEVELTGHTFYDTSWGCDGNLQQYGSQWFYPPGAQYAIAYPLSWLFVEGTSDTGIIANGEYWGSLGGRQKTGVATYAQGNVTVQLHNVGGITLPNYAVNMQVKTKINFRLTRFQKVEHLGVEFAQSFGATLDLYVRVSDGVFYNQDVLIKKIPRTVLNPTATWDKRKELYALSDYEWTFTPPLNGSIWYLDFYVKASDYVNAANFLLQNAPITGTYDWGIFSQGVVTSPYYFHVEAKTYNIANSITHKRNDLFGVPLLDYLQFVANKAGVALDVSELQTEGLNHIVYSSELLTNYTTLSSEQGDTYLSKVEETSLQELINWINKLFCATIYYYNNQLVIKTRRLFYIGTMLSQALMLDINRLLEIGLSNAPKILKLGGADYEVKLAENKESINTETDFELQVENTGETLDLSCNICLNPQFIDWLLVAKDITGTERCLIETVTDSNNDIQLYVWGTAKIGVNTNGAYTGASGFPTLQDWQQRYWLNIYLSPLAQFERWKSFISAPARERKYKIISSKNQYINIFDNLTSSFQYQKIYVNEDNLVMFNNSQTLIDNITAAAPTAIKVQDKDQPNSYSPLRLKIETPIYKEFVGNVPRQLVAFTYNNTLVYGLPTEIKTYFDRKVQEFEVIVLYPQFSISDLMD